MVATTTGHISIHAERCLNRLFQNAGCQRCQNVCPVACVKVAGHEIGLDESACVHCGACLAACPTDALVEASVPENDLVNAVRESRDQVVGLACPAAMADPAGRTRGIHEGNPEAAYFATPRCLAALGPSHLLQMADSGRRKVLLHDVPCAACSLAEAGKRLPEIVDEANAWMRALRLDPSLYLDSKWSGESGNEPTWRPVRVAVANPSRRSLFRLALGLEPSDASAEKTTNGVPAERQRLLLWLASGRRLPIEIAAGELPVANLQIHEIRCSACGLCDRVCPTKALSFLSDERRTFEIHFEAAACIDCDLCAVACPEAAIFSTEVLPVRALLDGKPEFLVGGLLRKCPTCPARVAHMGQHAQCHICRHGETVPSFLESP